MAPTTESEHSRLVRLVQRTGNPFNWHPADKCLFVTVISGAIVLVNWLLFWYLYKNPQVAPYVDRTVVGVALRVQSAFVAANLAVMVAALIMRGRMSGLRALQGAVALLYVSEVAWGSYLLGLHTNLWSGLTLLAGAAGGWILLDRRIVTWAIVLLLLALSAMTLAEQAGVIPYAPLLAAAPFSGGRLDSSFLLTVGSITFLTMLVILTTIYFVIDRWHDREHKLAITSQQLARANEVIGRYVASQLAEQVRAGNYYNLERHERRKLTLFFSDIQNFAAIADLVEPEELSTILNEYLSEMTAIGERYGATIDKFVGDAIMIFFGAPLATSDQDHALRAVRMAIEMQARLGELRTRWERNGSQHPFHIRIGINTGHASIGNFGSKTRMDYTAIGRQVNLAARLQTQCEPDRVLLAHSTWVLVRDEVPCVPKGEITVKGFRAPVTVYEVDGTPPTGAATAAEPV